MIRPLIFAAALISCTACARSAVAPGEEPPLSPVGAGTVAALMPEPPADPAVASNSLWRNSALQLYRDRRAVSVGDIVTVLIDVNDQAALNSTSSRSRTGSAGFGIEADADIGGFKQDGSIGFKGSGNTASNGQGSVQRSERVRLSVAATVTAAMPNGNLAIAGLQEMRINNEKRVLGVQGIVRLKDISPDNTIRYEQIAEARMTYGGSGRITEVQQPALLHQWHDRIAPF